jgi:hypothetical protein
MMWGKGKKVVFVWYQVCSKQTTSAKQGMPNNVRQTNNQIPLHSVPVNSAEHSGLNSGIRLFRRNHKTPEWKK